MNCRGMRRVGKPDDRITLTCGAETTNGLALCEMCQRKLVLELEYLPVYFRNLNRWRPGGTGRTVPGSREPRIAGSSDDRISRATDETGNMLTTWARVLADDRPEALLLHPAEAIFSDLRALAESETMALLCWGFERHLTSVATLDWCGEFTADIAEHEEALCYLTEQVAPGWYAGGCRQCGSGTYVVPGITWVTCRGCGVTTYARDHLDTILAEAVGWVAPPKALAHALVALLDAESSVDRLYDRIRKWHSLGWLEAVRRIDPDGDPIGPKRYRLGDVLDLIAGRAESATA